MSQQQIVDAINAIMNTLLNDIAEYTQFKLQRAANQLAGQITQVMLDNQQNANKDTEEPKT